MGRKSRVNSLCLETGLFFFRNACELFEAGHVIRVCSANLLFGSFVKDVAARGLDLPQVTWIVQVGWLSACLFILHHIIRGNICVVLKKAVNYYANSSTLRRKRRCNLLFCFLPFILQFNPPSSAAEYVHRVGRTARIGARGNSLLFLTPSETAYMDVLANHNIRSVM